MSTLLDSKAGKWLLKKDRHPSTDGFSIEQVEEADRGSETLRLVVLSYANKGFAHEMLESRICDSLHGATSIYPPMPRYTTS